MHTARMARRLPLLFLTLIAILAPPVHAVWGIPDQVPAATLVVPFVEVGVDVAVNPHDTLPSVFNTGGNDAIVHWEVWSVDGERTVGLFGNETIARGASWDASLRRLIDLRATEADKDLLDQGDGFYRGFMTIDLVTDSTFLTPFEVGYPFRLENAIKGVTLYARLLQGSINALAMVPLEFTTEDTETPNFVFFEGFYDDGRGHREEIDANARECAGLVTRGALCNGTVDGKVAGIRARVAQAASIDTNSRLIVFTWNAKRESQGGPSVICAELGCPQSSLFQRFDSQGTVIAAGQVRLDHVVNIITPPEGADTFGEYQILDLVDPNDSTQIYAFMISSAKPAEFPGQNWDAISEAMIEP